MNLLHYGINLSVGTFIKQTVGSIREKNVWTLFLQAASTLVAYEIKLLKTVTVYL